VNQEEDRSQKLPGRVPRQSLPGSASASTRRSPYEILRIRSLIYKDHPEDPTRNVGSRI